VYDETYYQLRRAEAVSPARLVLTGDERAPRRGPHDVAGAVLPFPPLTRKRFFLPFPRHRAGARGARAPSPRGARRRGCPGEVIAQGAGALPCPAGRPGSCPVSCCPDSTPRTRPFSYKLLPHGCYAHHGHAPAGKRNRHRFVRA
jgi:hypothetical protein